MIQFQEMTISNFGPFGKGNTVRFDHGVKFVEGENRDDKSASSNGAGKTSIFDALAWALFGQTTKTTKAAGDEVVNRRVGKDCSVSVSFSVGEHQCTVIRFRRDKEFKNELGFFIDGEDRRGGSNKDTQTAIIDMLGLDYEVFVRTVFCPQRQDKPFAEQTDAEAKAFFDRFLGLSKWSAPADTVKADIQKLDGMAATVAHSMQTCNAAIADAETVLRDADEMEATAKETYGEQSADVAGQIAEQEAKIAGHQKALDSVDREAVKAVADELIRLDADVTALADQVSTAKAKAEQRASRAAKIAELTAALEKMTPAAELGQREKSLAEKVAALESDVDKRRDEYRDAQKLADDIAAAAKAEEKCRAYVKELEAENAACPTCGQEIGKAKRAELLKAAKAEMDAALEVCRELGEAPDLEAVAASGKDAKLTLDARKKELESVRADKSRAENLESQIKAIAGDDDAVGEDIGDMEARLVEWRGKCATLRQKHTDMVRTEQVAMTALAGAKETLAALQKQAESVKSNYDKAVAFSEKSREKAERDRDAQTARRDDLAVQMTDISKKQAIAAFWKTGFSSSGIRNHLLGEVMPVLNEYAAEFSQKISDGSLEIEFTNKAATKSGEERERFGVNVVNKFGAGNFAGNSGGEAMKIAMIILFTLQRFNQVRSNRIALAIYDETFHSLDEQGIDRIVNVIRDEATDKAVFVVSHDPTIGGQIAGRVTVVKENGISRVEAT